MSMLSSPDSKVHRANMGPIWGQQDPGGPHVGPKNFAIWVAFCPRLPKYNTLAFLRMIWLDYAASLNEVYVTDLISETTRNNFLLLNMHSTNRSCWLLLPGFVKPVTCFLV